MKVIGAEEVQQRLTMPLCIEAVDSAMRAFSAGRTTTPARTWMKVAEDHSDLFGLMPGAAESLGVYGAKILTLHPENGARDLPVIQGFVALFDRRTGTPLALVEGASLTAIRTAAASALATRELARVDACSHGVFGTGVQAVTHIEAIAAVRSVSKTVVCGRDRSKAESFAAIQAERTGLTIIGTNEPREAAACDIISTVTSSTVPVLRGDWLKPGAHVNLVGAHESDTREADSEVLAGSRIYVDWLESALETSGDLRIPIAEGRISETDIVGEIGQRLNGTISGREQHDERTVYVSLGVVAQDLFAAARLLQD